MEDDLSSIASSLDSEREEEQPSAGYCEAVAAAAAADALGAELPDLVADEDTEIPVLVDSDDGGAQTQAPHQAAAAAADHSYDDMPVLIDTSDEDDTSAHNPSRNIPRAAQASRAAPAGFADMPALIDSSDEDDGRARPAGYNVPRAAKAAPASQDMSDMPSLLSSGDDDDDDDDDHDYRASASSTSNNVTRGTSANTCAQCGLRSDTPLLRCKRCKSAWYCSSLCQHDHWPEVITKNK